jgi:hypothetical protein
MAKMNDDALLRLLDVAAGNPELMKLLRKAATGTPLSTQDYAEAAAAALTRARDRSLGAGADQRMAPRHVPI